MIAAVLFLAFLVMMIGGVPIGVCLGLAGALAIVLADQSILAMPTNVYAGIAKYPLIAIPMFVLVGSVFDRTGVALRTFKGCLYNSPWFLELRTLYKLFSSYNNS
jgi:TRAP-type mannitol/chloroaromatic compound transport system permease large subunit